MKKLLQLSVSLAIILGTMPLAVAATMSVADAIHAPQAGESVTLKGRLIGDVGASTYKLQDNTGAMTVNISPRLVSEEALAANSQVEIVGTMVTPKVGGPQVDVGLVSVVQTIVEHPPQAHQAPQAPVPTQDTQN